MFCRAGPVIVHCARWPCQAAHDCAHPCQPRRHYPARKSPTSSPAATIASRSLRLTDRRSMGGRNYNAHVVAYPRSLACLRAVLRRKTGLYSIPHHQMNRMTTWRDRWSNPARQHQPDRLAATSGLYYSVLQAEIKEVEVRSSTCAQSQPDDFENAEALRRPMRCSSIRAKCRSALQRDSPTHRAARRGKLVNTLVHSLAARWGN